MYIIENRSQLTNFVNKFLGTIKFSNDQIDKIMGYGDYQIRNVTISRVYYVEGLGHNLFFVGQFRDSDLEEKARNNLINQNLKTPIKKLYLLHMDLYGSMRVERINGKKYSLVIVDNYSRFTWVKSLRSKDEALEFIIKFLKMIQLRINATVRNIRTDNGTIFSIKLCKAIMKILVSLMKQPWRVLHNKTALSKDETALYENFSKLKAKADVAMDSEQSSSGPALHEMTRGTLSSGLVPQPPSSIPFVPPIRDDSDTLLQLLFDEYFRPSPCVDHPDPKVAAPVHLP
nr:integrase, catalytic region, zinc finger, CCHC-type, peptidase aspartic, catalytic [Tanacetum cinerariifolium]